jgi:hypothetical protein
MEFSSMVIEPKNEVTQFVRFQTGQSKMPSVNPCEQHFLNGNRRRYGHVPKCIVVR